MNTIKIQVPPVDKSFLAQVALIRHSQPDSRPLRKWHTSKVEYDAKLCQKNGATIFNLPSDASLAAHFGLDADTAPSDLFSKGVTHPCTRMTGVHPVATVRFRVGEQDGEQRADILAMFLEGRFTWKDSMIAQVANCIAADLKGMGVTAVGGFKRAQVETNKDNEAAHNIRLLTGIKKAFREHFPLQEAAYFPVPGEHA